MRFGVDIHVVELMVSAGVGIVLSQYLQSSPTDMAVRSMATVGTYLVAKMGLYAATGFRQMVVDDTQLDAQKRQKLK